MHTLITKNSTLTRCQIIFSIGSNFILKDHLLKKVNYYLIGRIKIHSDVTIHDLNLSLSDLSSRCAIEHICVLIRLMIIYIKILSTALCCKPQFQQHLLNF